MGHTQHVIRPRHRGHVDGEGQLLLGAGGLPDEAEDGAVRIIRIDPLEALPGIIQLIHRRILLVEMQQLLHELLERRIQRLLAEIPVKRYILIPLMELTEILSHEQKLLARMTEHEEIAALQILELIRQLARHFIDHGALEMHHLIVGQHQNKLLRCRIAHAEGHLVVVALSEIGIQLHVIQEVMHPAHVPLVGEAQTIILRPGGYLRPGGGFLRNDDRAVLPAPHDRIQMLEELNGLQISVSAVAVRYPLAVLPAIVKIQHGRHRIHPQPVDMVLIIPVERIADEEVLHLILGIIEDLGAPVRVLAETRIRILVGGRAVELRQALGVLREVRRYPVQDHADAVLMQVVHHVHELLRLAVAGGRCIVARHLIAPGRVQRVLRDAHELHMGVAHLHAIGGQCLRRITIVHEAVVYLVRRALPGAEMHLINGHGLLIGAALGPVPHPVAVLPVIAADVRHLGRRTRPELGREGIGICLVQLLPVLGPDHILVDLALLHARHEALVDAAGLQRKHVIGLRIPLIPVTDDGNRLGMRCPDRKVNALLSLQHRRMGTHLLINLIMLSLSEKIPVKLRDKHRVQLLHRRLRLCLLLRRLLRRSPVHASSRILLLRLPSRHISSCAPAPSLPLRLPCHCI